LFDAVTKKLVGMASGCDAFALTTCTASSECIPSRCMPGLMDYTTSSICPPMPDGGIIDASSD
jgi:hypothetical protein